MVKHSNLRFKVTKDASGNFYNGYINDLYQ